MKNINTIVQNAINNTPLRPGLTFGEFQPLRDKGINRIDGLLPIFYQNECTKFSVLVKLHLHHAVIAGILAEKESYASNLMIITDQLGATHVEILINAGVAFMDMAGNISLDLPGMSTLITGRKLSKGLRQPTIGRAFQTSGLKLIYAFLTDLDSCDNLKDALINQSFRSINQQTGISLGSIGWILQDLRDAGFIVMDGKTRLLMDRKKLFNKWVAGYIDRLRPKLLTKRFSVSSNDWWKSVHLNIPDQLWGGEVAASKLTRFLKPQIVTIYTNLGIDDLILDAGLRVDQDGEVELMHSFWKKPIVHKDCTHPILVYADLLASDIDRNRETAHKIYDEYLRNIIESN
ncbi:MAG: type IV toxin-antitoxin system AbiEi family antitoxin [Bacteroidales bacterium]|nr:type IV toxin-antitoxin system AbiEi family antitoxin [Bacteroidales bacterium]